MQVRACFFQMVSLRAGDAWRACQQSYIAIASSPQMAKAAEEPMARNAPQSFDSRCNYNS